MLHRKKLSRSERVKKWVSEQSKTKPGKWIFGLTTGAGCASSTHALIDAGLSLLPIGGSLLTGLKIANFGLNFLVFCAATTVVMEGLRTTKQLSKLFIEVEKENRYLKQENLELQQDMAELKKDNEHEFNEFYTVLAEISRRVGFNLEPYLKRRATSEGYVMVFIDDVQSPRSPNTPENSPTSFLRQYSLIQGNDNEVPLLENEKKADHAVDVRAA